MSKLNVAFHRHAPDIAEAERRARRCLSEITPDIFRAGARIETRIETRTEAAGAGHQVQAVLNLPDSSLRSGMSLCQGRILGSRAGWAEPGGAAARAFGRTAEFRRAEGEGPRDTHLVAGIRIWF